MTAFWIDHDHDREYASDGISRYGSYLNQNAHLFTDVLDSVTHFAVECWRVANSPIMSPGYVRWHPRIISARVEHNAWDGTLVGRVALVIPWPAVLDGAREWRAGARWNDWPTEYVGGEGERYLCPGEEDLTRGSYLMCSSEMAFPLPTAYMQKPPASAKHLLPVAQDTVSVLVSELNQIVDPVLAALEGS